MKESILPPVCEDDDEGEEKETLGGIASRPASRPRSVYSRGSVDGQVSTIQKFRLNESYSFFTISHFKNEKCCDQQ